MNRRALKIIGINPGTRYIGIAILYGQELMDWRVKVLSGKWSNKKMHKALAIISENLEKYQPNILVIKKLHPSRRSENLLRLATKIKEFSSRKKLKVCQYSIKELEKFFIDKEKLNKVNLIKAIVQLHTMLHHDLTRETNHKNAYFIRGFEAVALASACAQRFGES